VKLVEIDLNLIDEDIEQPRKQFDKTSIEELAESIREVGLLNPIKVYKIKYGRYKIVFGNRRYKALKLLGFRKIPCILSDNTDELDIYFEQLTENIQRRDFTPIEEAMGYQKLLDGEGKLKVSKKYLSSRLGKTEKYITNKLSLLVFGPEIRKLIHSGAEIIAGVLSEEQALHLKDVPVEYRDQLALKVAKNQSSAKDVKRIAQLFVSAEAGVQLKEKFLKLPCHELIALSIDGERRKELEKSATPPKPAAAAKTKPDPGDNLTVSVLNTTPKMQEELNNHLDKIAAFPPLRPEMIEAIAAIPDDKKTVLRDTVTDALTALESQVKQWTQLKVMLEKNAGPEQ
jgi:ParB family transcriptional regulator, chromosome partitioning protein